MNFCYFVRGKYITKTFFKYCFEKKIQARLFASAIRQYQLLNLLMTPKSESVVKCFIAAILLNTCECILVLVNDGPFCKNI